MASLSFGPLKHALTLAQLLENLHVFCEDEEVILFLYRSSCVSSLTLSNNPKICVSLRHQFLDSFFFYLPFVEAASAS